ncbi:ATP-binding protein [uncultured Prevotella sp.]|jgi:CheY-like chemotaxis protein/nitrogen-specific signal transduction histidine kinase|uniref:ATP-binding protein n=1 Tax=uncultured Prevotella sp. TaxID=159272 RepID=UPI0025DB07BC|nr:ATP-binding protein [uncultured Prevotella sp.]
MSLDEKEILSKKLAEVTQELELANKQLQQANQKLKEYEEKAAKAEKASQMKSLFLANMSHEIRTPLNAIEGFSRVMAETDSQEERLNYMEIIESNNSRLLSLVNEILDLSRVESGEIVIKKNPTDLNTLMNSIKQLFKFRCPETVALTWQKPEVSAVMDTDENRITQVFSNLISNALKHTPKGSITFGYRLINDTEEIEFFVSDTGSGIDPNFIDHIFDTYASKDAEQQRGFGLGLALCRIIVEKMGGNIKVDSKVGEGSNFVFTLPFSGNVGGLAISNRFGNNMRTLRVSHNLDQNNMKTVLVAEDEESNYELVRIVLQKRYNLIRAHNGIEAVTMFEEEKPDLILMDIRMPEMDGLDATRIIKEVNQEVPVIALSAYAFPENIREAKAAGCDEFMAKPFKVEDLIELIRHYIGA